MTTENRAPAGRLALAGILLLFMLLTVAGLLAREWRPPNFSEHGRGVDRMITYILFAAGFIFVVGHLVLSWFIVKYGRRDGGPWRPMSPTAERLFALGPVVFMVAISEIGVLFIGTPVWNEVFTKKDDDLVVEIVGKQFEWLARYPGKDAKFGRRSAALFDETENPLGLDKKDPAAKDDIVTRGLIVVPEKRATWLNIESWDMLHSFCVPAFRTKQDAVPGITSHSRFTPTAVGRYEVACAELCGLGHYRMKGYVDVKSQEAFAKWLAAQPGWFE
jgi:cytochrome c oxidase subunit 2